MLTKTRTAIYNEYLDLPKIKKAIKKKKLFLNESKLEFRIEKSLVWFASFCIVVAVGTAFIPEIMVRIFIPLLFLIPGAFLMLTWVFSKIYMMKK